jgi:hypothetical protein
VDAFGLGEEGLVEGCEWGAALLFTPEHGRCQWVAEPLRTTEDTHIDNADMSMIVDCGM